MTKNEIIALIRSPGAAGIRQPTRVRVAGGLDTGGRMMSEADIGCEAERILAGP